MTKSKWLVMFFMLGLLMAGCSNVVYPDPIPEPAESLTAPLEDSDKEIVSVRWMKSDFSVEIKSLSAGDAAGLIIKTKGYAPGEKVTITIDDKNTNDDGGSYTVVRRIIGVVDERGEVRAWVKA